MALQNNNSRAVTHKARRSKSKLIWLSVFVVSAAGAVLYSLWNGQSIPFAMLQNSMNQAQPEAPKYKEALEFAMTDFDHGWIRYADQIMVTSDGGVSWTTSDTVPTAVEPTSLGNGELRFLQAPKTISIVNYQSKEYSVKQSQFMTDHIGWAIVNDNGEAGSRLLSTTDGGTTWQTDVTGAVRQALEDEKLLLQRRNEESAFYASLDQTKLALQSEWLLIPNTVNQGDVVLVRHDKPDKLEWQGKSYTLQPFGAGYFTYLPVGTNVPPGDYPIGNKTLKVVSASFPKQYLQVSEQLESMRQDTKRIEADQVKIDAARSQSEPQFLFQSTFLKPIEGILTTPYGHMRYVNGKLSGSHLALDLAAKQGTPIKATNDGIVALADNLYLTGNSIYLDHGMGLFSQYAHMSELRVKTGDRVKRGDIIGLVGTTGFSTGPHLHFTFWANNVPVNPNLFFEKTPFQWLEKSTTNS
ncbi:M23 family metallopeptidase [Paenibacillus sp. UNC451MF]|uniref:M23 family metallopeptidase n=1 Tax=Paenibacillus sp. UNC451MF TaxID=1449063 RepID=UPI00068DFC26|nr:M23 family metallopeptidase [Paenibacillus sp. UNC451MF]